MKMCVVPEDSCIAIDGERRHVDMPTADPNWHALHYDSSTGAIRFEVKSGFQDALAGEPAAAMAQPFIAAWEAAEPPAE